MRTRGIVTACAVLALLTGCVDLDDDTTSQPEAGTEPAPVSEREVDGYTPARPMFGGSGTLVLDSQTIELQQVQCFLEPRNAPNDGGGQILFVGQALGVDASGQDVMLDVSRFDHESQFAGDRIEVVIDDFTATSSDQIRLESQTPEGTVTFEGTTLRADGITLTPAAGGSERAASFELTC